MTYEESITIISAFKTQYSLLVSDPNVIGISVRERNNEFLLEISIKKNTDISWWSTGVNQPLMFTYNYEDQEHKIKIEIKESDIYYALTVVKEHAHQRMLTLPVRAGDSARGIDLAGVGTAGWIIYLNQRLVCISNWHVFCGRGNNTPIGRGIQINGENIASLFLFEPIYFGLSKNIWDFALGEIRDSSAVAAEMRACEDGSVYPYPMQLSTNVKIDQNEKFHKVGIRIPICRQGNIVGVGDVRVKYHDGQIATFIGQLIFSKMTDSGDSGSVIVRDSDNTVTGLNFAGNEHESISNPLFTMGWETIGTRIFGKTSIPVLQTAGMNNNYPFLSQKGQKSNSLEYSMENQTFDIPQLGHPYLPPVFVTGKEVIFNSFPDHNGRTLQLTFLVEEIRGPWVKLVLKVYPGGHTTNPLGWMYIPNSQGFWK